MKSHKKTGSYYTPDFLSKFMMKHVGQYFKNREQLSILEPSVGSGNFIKAFNETSFPTGIKAFSIVAVEKLKSELKKAQAQSLTNKKRKSRYSFINEDFLKYQIGLSRRFSLIVGNPPYIRRTLLNKKQIKICDQISQRAGLKKRSVKNIWPFFLIQCSLLLEQDGILAFVLPAELLQVQFSLELREFLINRFQRTEIFTFHDILFECKGQDTILLIAYKTHEEPGQFYTGISDIGQLERNDFLLAKNHALSATKTKWSHHLLSGDELSFIYALSDQIKTIDHFCISKPGIVTAANEFFIVNEATERLYNLSRYLKPIIQKGNFVNGSIVFDNSEYDELVRNGKPSKVLCIAEDEATGLPNHIKQYLKLGVDRDLPSGHKCSRRKYWYVIPNMSSISDGFFLRRVHHYPKLLKNSAQVLITDTAYQIHMKENYSIDHLIFSFYNSLSLAFAELNGRYYGGGVLELTPSEFKNIPIPYSSIAKEEFKGFRKVFEDKSRIQDVLFAYDDYILNSTLGLSTDDVRKIQEIYGKLVDKRFRKPIRLNQ